jgi:hypothetical protein
VLTSASLGKREFQLCTVGSPSSSCNRLRSSFSPVHTRNTATPRSALLCAQRDRRGPASFPPSLRIFRRATSDSNSAHPCRIGHQATAHDEWQITDILLVQAKLLPDNRRSKHHTRMRSSQRRSPGADPGAPPNVPPRSMSPAVGVGTNRPVAPRSSAPSRSNASGSGSRNDGTRRANVSSALPASLFPCRSPFGRRPSCIARPNAGFKAQGPRPGGGTPHSLVSRHHCCSTLVFSYIPLMEF